MYINDLLDMISGTVHIFADDTNVYRNVLTEYGSNQLQPDLTRLVQWSETWLMSFNIEKCILIHLSHNNRQITYNMGQTELQTSSVEKDLGMLVDDRLNFKKHVSNAVNKASRILCMIQATFSCLDEDTVPQLYKTQVRPHLEYGNIIWHPAIE